MTDNSRGSRLSEKRSDYRNRAFYDRVLSMSHSWVFVHMSIVEWLQCLLVKIRDTAFGMLPGVLSLLSSEYVSFGFALPVSHPYCQLSGGCNGLLVKKKKMRQSTLVCGNQFYLCFIEVRSFRCCTPGL